MIIDNIYCGGKQVLRIFLGGRMIWPATTEHPLDPADLVCIITSAVALRQKVGQGILMSVSVMTDNASTGVESQTDAVHAVLYIEPMADITGHLSPSNPSIILEPIRAIQEMYGRISPSAQTHIDTGILALHNVGGRISASVLHLVDNSLCLEHTANGRESLSVRMLTDVINRMGWDVCTTASLSVRGQIENVQELSTEANTVVSGAFGVPVGDSVLVDSRTIGVDPPALPTKADEILQTRQDAELHDSPGSPSGVDHVIKAGAVAEAEDSEARENRMETTAAMRVSSMIINSVFTSADMQGVISTDSETTANTPDAVKQATSVLAQAGSTMNNTVSPVRKISQAEMEIRVSDSANAKDVPAEPLRLITSDMISASAQGGESVASDIAACAKVHASSKSVGHGSVLKDIRVEKVIIAAPLTTAEATKMTPIEFATPVHCGCSAVLSFDPGTPSEWFDPIRTGSNLYIRSVWLSYQDMDNMFVDTAVWYEVIRNGSNLYIRSVDSSWQDGDKAYIDLSVFHEPNQEGGNLYIRSAYSVWTDGGGANIDLDYFLDPIQDGSNLYIRQSIFEQ